MPFKASAELIGLRLELPVASRERVHLGWFADFAAADVGQQRAHSPSAGLKPSEPDPLRGLDRPGYYL